MSGRVLLGVVLLATSLAACTVKDPTYCDEQISCPAGQHCYLPGKLCMPDADAKVLPDGASRDAAGELTAKKQNGESCVGGGECGSWSWADGVCCEDYCR